MFPTAHPRSRELEMGLGAHGPVLPGGFGTQGTPLQVAGEERRIFVGLLNHPIRAAPRGPGAPGAPPPTPNPPPPGPSPPLPLPQSSLSQTSQRLPPASGRCRRRCSAPGLSRSTWKASRCWASSAHSSRRPAGSGYASRMSSKPPSAKKRASASVETAMPRRVPPVASAPPSLPEGFGVGLGGTGGM